MVQTDVRRTAAASAQGTRSFPRDGIMIASALMMAMTLYLVFLWVPTEQNLGLSQRIFYFHVPIAWLGMLSIIVVAFASAAHLITKKEKWDNFAYSAAELGLVFLTLLLISGIIWNKPAWGKWWTWDPKLTTTLILWFIYVGYMMLRAYGPVGSQGARYGAVLALIGTIDSVFIYMATSWWRTQHPELLVGPLADEESFLDSRMWLTLGCSTVTFTVLYISMLIERYSLKRGEAEIDKLYHSVS